MGFAARLTWNATQALWLLTRYNKLSVCVPLKFRWWNSTPNMLVLGGGSLGGDEVMKEIMKEVMMRSWRSWWGQWRRKWQPTPVFLPGESPWTEEPGRLLSMGSKRVRHNWSDLAHTWGHEGGAFMSGISALLKMTPGQSPCPFQARTQQKDLNQEAGPHLTSDLPSSWFWSSSL